MAQVIDKNKIVVFTGAGVSAESGLQTFRDSNGLWNDYPVSEVATPEAWERNPELVLNFYNERRKNAAQALPNKAHLAIAELQNKFEVIVVTQNVDDLHERAGSKHVIHVHGELTKARSTVDSHLIYTIGADKILMGSLCEKGSQLRPHIVWFGEAIEHYDIALHHIETAARVLAIGSSLTVYPAAGLLFGVSAEAEKILVSLEVDQKPRGFKWIAGTAGEVVPGIIKTWMQAG